MKESICKPLSVISLLRISSLNRLELSDHDYVVVNDLFLKYKELGPSRLISLRIHRGSLQTTTKRTKLHILTLKHENSAKNSEL